MEPDHSASIEHFMNKYSNTIVSSTKAFEMMNNYFGTQYDSRQIVVKEGDELPEDYVCPLCKHGASDFEPIH